MMVGIKGSHILNVAWKNKHLIQDKYYGKLEMDGLLFSGMTLGINGPISHPYPVRSSFKNSFIIKGFLWWIKFGITIHLILHGENGKFTIQNMLALTWRSNSFCHQFFKPKTSQ